MRIGDLLEFSFIYFSAIIIIFCQLFHCHVPSSLWSSLFLLMIICYMLFLSENASADDPPPSSSSFLDKINCSTLVLLLFLSFDFYSCVTSVYPEKIIIDRKHEKKDDLQKLITWDMVIWTQPSWSKNREKMMSRMMILMSGEFFKWSSSSLLIPSSSDLDEMRQFPTTDDPICSCLLRSVKRFPLFLFYNRISSQLLSDKNWSSDRFSSTIKLLFGSSWCFLGAAAKKERSSWDDSK